jgi:hypothetical protein
MRIRFSQALFAVAVVTALGALAASGARAAPRDDASSQERYRYLTLGGVDALSGDDVWVAGGGDGGSGSVRHWDGQRWKGVPPGEQGVLSDVAEPAPDEVWAVGRQSTGTAAVGVIVHWADSHWTRMTSPADLDGQYNSLRSVSAISETNVVATGQACLGEQPCTQTAIRWDGRRWRLEPGLEGITVIDARNPSDAWAVGAVRHGFFSYTALIKHWDGARWTRVPCPNPGDGGTLLSGVTVVSADDVWAVGGSHGQRGGNTGMVSMHWDGNTWTQVPTPFDQLWSNYLGAVGGVAADDVWAVGGDSERGRTPRLLHWDGTSWTSVDNPAAGLADSTFTDIEVVSSDDAWIVGYWNVRSPTGADRILMHWDGRTWTLHHSPG